MEAFWRHGFRAASTETLLEETGMNRFSLYAEFGSKAGLFAEALRYYNEVAVTNTIGVLELPDASLDTLLQVFESFQASAQAPGSEKGCLMCNTAMELAPQDAMAREAFSGYVDRLVAACRNALEHSRADGEIPAEVDLSALAAVSASVMIGMFVMLRGGVEPTVLGDAVRGVATVLGRPPSREGSSNSTPDPSTER